MDFRIGMTFQAGKYQVEQVLGQSDGSLTLKAIAAPARSVILKTLNPTWQTHPQYVAIQQHFVEQVSRFARCQHPALVQWLDSFEEQGLPFVVTDDTAGRSLAEIVQTQGALPIDTAIRIIQQVGAALLTLHRHQLIHHQVCPHNIVQPVGSEIGVLVNVSFVAGKIFPPAGQSRLPASPTYAAIEQYQPHLAVTPATDLYGLAGTLYFLLTGHAPVAAPLRSQTAIVAPRQLNPKISLALETAILQGLEMNPKARPVLNEWLSGLAAMVGSVAATSPAAMPLAPNLSATPPAPVSKPVRVSTQTVSTPLSPSPSSPMLSVPSKRFSGAILTTAAIAAAIGIGTGLTLRLAATTTGSGTTFFHSRQSFPTLGDWPGESLPLQMPSLPAAPPPAQVEVPRLEQVPTEAPVVPPPVPTPAPEVPPPVPEAAPVAPESVAPPAAVPEAVPPPAPNAIVPEPAPVAPPPVAAPEPAPPPPVSQPAPPSAPSN